SGVIDSPDLLSRIGFRIPGTTRSRDPYYLASESKNYLDDDPLRRAMSLFCSEPTIVLVMIRHTGVLMIQQEITYRSMEYLKILKLLTLPNQKEQVKMLFVEFLKYTTDIAHQNYFIKILLNGEKVKRNYLVYSESTGSVFCAPCKLFGSTSLFSTVGFSDWKHTEKRITSHENSQTHKTNVLTMKDRGKVAQRIDSALILQIEGEKNYWKNVLRRVVAVVKTLSFRGLAFRGKTDKFGCNQNASTHRWSELEGTVKCLSATRWSARDDACHSLSKSWNNIVHALHKISNNRNEKPSTKCEAVGLLKKLNRLETVFITIFWTNILDRSVYIDLITVVELSQSLIHYVESLRNEDSFKIFEDIAIKKSGIKDYNDHNKRKRKRKIHVDENNNEVLFSERDYLIINTYYVILNKLSYELKRRKLADDELLHEITPEKIKEDAKVLQKTYPNDLATCFVNECLQFQGHMKHIKVNVTTIQMLQFIREHDITSGYPYVEFRAFFFHTKKNKNYLRSTMAQDRCSALAVLAIEAEITLH
ncbi:zinc finger MYM-type protein 1-like, partial [Aphis craccivora]